MNKGHQKDAMSRVRLFVLEEHDFNAIVRLDHWEWRENVSASSLAVERCMSDEEHAKKKVESAFVARPHWPAIAGRLRRREATQTRFPSSERWRPSAERYARR